MKSDRNLRPALVLSFLLAAGCSGKPAEEQAAVPAEAAPVAPLADAELKGIERDKVVLTLPWSDGPVSHDPDANALKGSLTSIELSGGEGYDRAQFEFDEHMNLPGYRVVWNDTTARACRDPKAPAASPLLYVEFEPATAKARKGPATLQPAGALPSLGRARQLCDDDSQLTWALEADSAQVRVTELRSPPRLVVDVAHKAAAAPAAAEPAAAEPAAPAAEAPPAAR